MDYEVFNDLGYSSDPFELSMWKDKVKENILEFKITMSTLKSLDVILDFEIHEEYHKPIKSVNFWSLNQIISYDGKLFDVITKQDRFHYLVHLAGNTYPDNQKIIDRLYYAAWMRDDKEGSVDRKLVEGDEPLTELVPNVPTGRAARKLLFGADPVALSEAYEILADYKDSLHAKPAFLKAKLFVEDTWSLKNSLPYVLVHIEEMNDALSTHTVRSFVNAAHPESRKDTVNMPKTVLLDLFPDVKALGPAAKEILSLQAELRLLLPTLSKRSASSKVYSFYDKLAKLDAQESYFVDSVNERLWGRYQIFGEMYHGAHLNPDRFVSMSSLAHISYHILKSKNGDKTKSLARTYLDRMDEALEILRLITHKPTATAKQIEAIQL